MKKLLGHLILFFSRWRWEGPIPTESKYVLIAAPHTTNWDLVHMLALGAVQDVSIHWMGKHTLFKFPFGGFMRWTGGIAVDRRSRQNLVEQLIEEFARRDALALAVPAAGTRSRREYWKSGFYWIALGAGVPVVPGFLDYRRKVGGFGEPVHLTGDVRKDMDVFRAFYSKVTALYPEKVTRVRLREEDEADAADAAASGEVAPH
ncbi:MAG: lysophospholipid acyltransferase family protein [Deltaproteobacteria bacterium]|nr:lysophospholipid acyltransferase family protein [Deltaproteobacteria bacterium]